MNSNTYLNNECAHCSCLLPLKPLEGDVELSKLYEQQSNEFTEIAQKVLSLSSDAVATIAASLHDTAKKLSQQQITREMSGSIAGNSTLVLRTLLALGEQKIPGENNASVLDMGDAVMNLLKEANSISMEDVE